MASPPGWTAFRRARNRTERRRASAEPRSRNPPLPRVRLIRFAHMLTPRERRVLDFERSWWKLPGPKDRDIKETLGFSSTMYYRVLRESLDKAEAMAYDPLTVRRLRRLRAGTPQTLAEGRDPADL